MAIKAIETKYNGYRFRSRLEARWAVFFDALGVPWRYELQGYVTYFDSGGQECYLPDFLVGLPGAGHTYFEAKPYIFDQDGWTKETKRTLRVMRELCYVPVDGIESDSFAGFVVGGDPSVRSMGVLAIPLYHDGTLGPENENITGAVIGAYALLAVCPCCGKFSFFLVGTKDDPRFQVLCGCIDPRHKVYVKQHRAREFLEAPVLVGAVTMARSARFEHGETPRVPRGKPRKGG